MSTIPIGARIDVGASLLLAGILVLLLSLPLVRGSIPRNGLYGIRVRKAFESAANWYAINRCGGLQMITYGAAVALAGLAYFVLPLAPDRWYFWALLLSPLWLLVPVLWRIFAFARRLPRSASAAAGRSPRRG